MKTDKKLLEKMKESATVIREMTAKETKSFNSRVANFLTAVVLYLEKEQQND
jgi:hypothetical protein